MLVANTDKSKLKSPPLSGIDVDEQVLVGFSRETLAQVQTALTDYYPGSAVSISIPCWITPSKVRTPSLAFGLSLLLHAKLMGKLVLSAHKPPPSFDLSSNGCGQDLLDNKLRRSACMFIR